MHYENVPVINYSCNGFTSKRLAIPKVGALFVELLRSRMRNHDQGLRFIVSDYSKFSLALDVDTCTENKRKSCTDFEALNNDH